VDAEMIFSAQTPAILFKKSGSSHTLGRAVALAERFAFGDLRLARG
jgi:hypothetical protein